MNENHRYEGFKGIEDNTEANTPETFVYRKWLNHVNEVLDEAGIHLRASEVSEALHVAVDNETNTDLALKITFHECDRKLIECNLLRSALADVTATPAAHDRKDAAERKFTRRMRRSLSRLEPTLAYLNGRLYDTLKDSTKQVSAVYGIMKGETEPSAFLAVTEPGRTPSGETLGERHLLETHTPNDVLDFFGLEAAK